LHISEHNTKDGINTLERHPSSDGPSKVFFSSIFIRIRRPWAQIFNNKKGDAKENDNREE
jgi:hypothetical protein